MFNVYPLTPSLSLSLFLKPKVMHDATMALPQILSSYPRGQRELHGLYAKHFTPQDMKSWFTSRGVTLKTEQDGRMFPITDSSQTIMDVIQQEAQKWNVDIQLGCKVMTVEKDDDDDGYFLVTTSAQKQIQQHAFDSIILATGSSPSGHDIASQLGLNMVNPIPSLFTLELKQQVKDVDGILHGLAGLSVPFARITFRYKGECVFILYALYICTWHMFHADLSFLLNIQPPPNNEPTSFCISIIYSNSCTKYKNVKQQTTKTVPNRKKKQSITQEGPLLLTHHGLSGPAALRLSAFAARELADVNYNCDLSINWCTSFGTTEEVEDALWTYKSTASPKRFVSSVCPLGNHANSKQPPPQEEQQSSTTTSTTPPLIPKRLWNALCIQSNIQSDTTWGNISKKQIRSLSNSLTNLVVYMSGKGIFKEEFVTAGGISTKDVNMSTMSSKKMDGLYVCGEVLNVDGVTGGFNFMNCWSTGFMAGVGAATFVIGESL
mmetsp:Transcript_36516/g.53494  ORF Transcript_36516/g.53494 Transcript_36516/m.53494 type:complete len:492 (+) Transcript_36516:1090-2565(+)